MSDSNDTSIALLSQKIDHYKEATTNQLTGIQTLLETHVVNIRSELDDHDHRITRNADEIAALKVAHSRTTGFFVAIGALVTGVATFVGSLWSGLWVHPH